MKTNHSILYGLAILLSFQSREQVYAQSDAAKNPDFYSIIYLSGDNAQEMIYHKSLFEHKEQVPEILPANQDTNGNWGSVIENWQISSRFRRRQFSTNEPVLAVLILRNLSLTSRTMVLSDYSYKYILLQGTNTSVYEKKIPHRDEQREDSSESWYTINTKSEGLVSVRLNNYFDLNKPGKYLFQAQIRVPKLNAKGYTNILSGMATFEIVQTAH